MELAPAAANGKETWNRFIRAHYPPVGAFIQSWEWGEFQKALGRTIERYFLNAGREPVAALTLVHHALPLGLAYAYAPRGPVISSAVPEQERSGVLDALRQRLIEKFPRLAFIRLEPPLPALAEETRKHGFVIPSYYVQPRFNLAVSLDEPEEAIMQRFHTSTRSNIRRAEKRGVEVQIKPNLAAEDLGRFFAMARDTIARNNGKNAYPSQSYFQSLVKTVPDLDAASAPNGLRMGTFFGYQEGEPAAVHFVVFFGGTATYLYGASYTRHLNSKVTTSLHWTAMREAKKRGISYYDLGGIDETRWPTLTTFKRQFGGEEFSYLGNLDIPVRPGLYRIYNAARRLHRPW